MSRCFDFVWILFAGMALASCGLLKKKGPEMVKGTENAAGGPTYLIGLVEMVNPEQKFVLIRTETKTTIPAGHLLTAIDATGARSTLKVSPENKQNFLTADITEGVPRIGNLVIYRPGQQGLAVAKPDGQPASPSTVTPAGQTGTVNAANPAGAASSPIPLQPLPPAPPPSAVAPAGSVSPPPVPSPGPQPAAGGGLSLPSVVR